LEGNAMASEATFLMQQFLSWVDTRPRRHAEVREAWSSTCPLNCAWEDALADDLVRFDDAGHLVLSELGRARLVGRVEPGAAGGNPPKPGAASVGIASRHPPHA
jgi:hypothetical protein